ncbi:MAG: tetratricopeptide repeat protein, partial [Elusimicrobiota bacterium]
LYNPLIDSLEKAAGRVELAVFRAPSGAVAFTVYRAGVRDVAGASRAWASAIASVAGTESYSSSTLWLGKAAELSRDGGASPADRAAALALTRKVLASSADPMKIRHAALILKALGAYGEAAVIFERLSSSSPGDAQLQSELAFCSARIGHKKEALQAARRALTMPGDTELARRAASVMQSLDAPGEAVVVLERLAAGAPEDAGLQVNLAQVYIRLGRKEDALRAARKALTLKSGAEVDRSAAILLQDLGFAPEASEILERLLRAAPNDAALETDAAVAQYLTGRREEAVARLRKIVARHPELVAARRNLDAALSK